MGFNTHFQDVDGYMDIEFKDGKHPTIDETEVSTFTMEILPLADEKLLVILFKNRDFIPPELLVYLQQSGIPSQRGRGENDFSCEEG